MNTIIRKSTPNDVYEIREVQRITWLDTYPNKEEGITVEDIINRFRADKTSQGKKKIEEYRKRYQDKNTAMWVIEIKNKIIGFCMATKEDKNGRIQAIYVLPSHQSKGLGSKLIKETFKWLGDSKDILLNVASYNSKAINFYIKHGFIKTGKEGTLDDAAKLPSGKIIPEIELIK